ncbi:MAG: hypothetical protein C3F06_10450 [Candidatus Methanoperedenaceae archaeon]|nr:MAG: hypothetical protein C3F06_10450 [Candidatus Methanoperedenaceae archaeon]
MLELLLGTRTKVKLLKVLAASGDPMTRNELAHITHSGNRSTYEQIEELIAIGVLKEIENGRSRLALDPEFPFYDSIRDLFLSVRDYPGIPQDILKMVDRICKDNYYLGAFTAARQKITPIDYDPPIYMVNILKKFYPGLSPRVMALGKLPGVRAYENMGEAGEMTIIPNTCENIPPDVKRIDHLNVEVWIASVERGIIECLTRKTPFTKYGTYLALLQNRLDNAINLEYFRKLAAEENCLPRVLAVMLEFNEISGKEIFPLTQEDKSMASKATSAVDKKEIKHAINTVMG